MYRYCSFFILTSVRIVKMQFLVVWSDDCVGGKFESALKLHTILLPLSKQEGVLQK